MREESKAHAVSACAVNLRPESLAAIALRGGEGLLLMPALKLLRRVAVRHLDAQGGLDARSRCACGGERNVRAGLELVRQRGELVLPLLALLRRCVFRLVKVELHKRGVLAQVRCFVSRPRAAERHARERFLCGGNGIGFLVASGLGKSLADFGSSGGELAAPDERGNLRECHVPDGSNVEATLESRHLDRCRACATISLSFIGSAGCPPGAFVLRLHGLLIFLLGQVFFRLTPLLFCSQLQ